MRFVNIAMARRNLRKSFLLKKRYALNVDQNMRGIIKMLCGSDYDGG